MAANIRHYRRSMTCCSAPGAASSIVSKGCGSRTSTPPPGPWITDAFTTTTTTTTPIAGSRGLPLVSHRLRITGVANLVEFRTVPAAASDLPASRRVRASRSRRALPHRIQARQRRRWDNDDVQLCAQALCLEEMLGVTVPEGAIFHVQSKHRRAVVFTPALRQQTEDAAVRLHALLAGRTAPPPVLHPKCKECSLHDICLPELLSDPADYRRAAAGLFSVPPGG